jgi:hypothetical protein
MEQETCYHKNDEELRAVSSIVILGRYSMAQDFNPESTAGKAFSVVEINREI